MKSPKLLVALLLLLLLGSSCYKYNPLPPGVVDSLKLLEQHPFESYLDSLEALTINTDSELVTYIPVGINDPNLKEDDSSTGQQEIAYAFRSSVGGLINQLGVYVPFGGYTHTVTVWDSATGEVVSQANVASASPGWSFTDLVSIGQEATILPDHGYIVGFNSDAVGVPINTVSQGNEVYLIDGIYDFKSNPPPGGIPMIPFTWQSITYEGFYAVSYDTPISAPIFPGKSSIETHDITGFVGGCDIGFLPL
jgi:hypothetical protein